AIDVPSLFERGPGVLARDVHLAKKDGDIALADVFWQYSARDLAPECFSGLIVAQLSIDDCAAIAFHNPAIAAHDDALKESFVDQDLTVELPHIGILPKDGLELSLQRRD